MTLQGQLEAGIRFINLELHNDVNSPEKIACYFGNTNLEIFIRNVLDILNAFLNVHIKEMVLLQYNWKGTEVQKLNDVFNEYSNINILYKNIIYVEEYANDQFSTPTLGQVRGKVVLINSDAAHSKGSLAFNHGSTTVFRYENRTITNRKGECKPRLFVDKLMKHIDTAGEVMVADQYYITWATYNVYPCQCRESFNLDLQKLIYKSYDKQLLPRVGIVVMDFFKEEYISTIIRFNFQGTAFKCSSSKIGYYSNHFTSCFY